MTTRRLAAILAADIVGFSSLMGTDEEGTLARLMSLRREVMEPRIAEHHGRVFKMTGDGLLAEFASPVEAVRCAVAVQEDRASRDSQKPSKALQLRIGINLGDIIIEEDGDVYGDGVNVAARLEQLAAPGGISISGKVYEEVRDKVPYPFEDRGEQQVKNIARPVRVYAIGGLGSTGAASEPKALPLPDKPSIAVLPFTNMSGDPEQEYLAEGIVDDLITNLYRAKWLFVIARTSSFAYKGRAVDVKQVGRELGVRYVLEGSIRKSGRRIRITGQLIDATTGSHIWSDRFEDSLEDIFDLQDRVAESVMGAIEPTIRSAEIERAKSRPTESLGAYDLYLRALPLHYANERERLREAQRLLARAIELDPTYSKAKAFSALTAVIQANQGWTAPDEQQEGIRLAREALADHNDDPVTLRCAGHALAYLAHDHEVALAVLERALTLNPNSAEVHHSAGWVHNFAGNGSKAAKHFQRAIRLSPLDREIGHSWIGMSFAELLTGRYADALGTSKRAMAAMPTSLSPLRAGIVALVQLDRLEEANRLGRAVLEINPKFRVGEFRKIQPFKDEEFVNRYMDALRAAGIPE